MRVLKASRDEGSVVEKRRKGIVEVFNVLVSIFDLLYAMEIYFMVRRGL